MFEALRRFFATLHARLSMPLLMKELAETSARRRTYILRVVYAIALFVIFWITLPSRSSYSNARFALLGYGRELFERLVVIQVFGVALFQPALMCGRVTQEKERDSLVLLFLTKLRPWEIVLQKYFGGLVPMLSFLLLGLPLAGVAYAFGGLETDAIFAFAAGLFVLCLQVGAFTLMWSAWCRSTVSALICSYLFGLAFYAGFPLSWHLVNRYGSDDHAFCLIPPAAFEIARRDPHPYWICTPSIVSVGVFLLLARAFLIRRAFVPASNFLPRFFGRIDRFMKSINRLVGNVVLYRDTGSLPVDEPVFWRDTQRRALGKAHYLFRLLCFIEIPTVFFCLAVVLGTSWDGSSLSVALIASLVLVFFCLSATAANGIVSERVGQTLEVLLTTPLSARQILQQKDRAASRLSWVLAAPLLTIYAVRAFLWDDYWARNRVQGGWFAYLTCGVLVILIYLPMIRWLSMWIGLRVRTRFQAILAALGVLATWMAIAPLILIATETPAYGDHAESWLLLASPMGVPLLNELGRLPRLENLGSPWPWIITNAMIYTAAARFFRYRLFADADRYLRR